MVELVRDSDGRKKNRLYQFIRVYVVRSDVVVVYSVRNVTSVNEKKKGAVPRFVSSRVFLARVQSKLSS